VTCGGAACAGNACSIAACSAATCANGCCEGTVCKTPSVDRCGTGGVECRGCDPLKADTCRAGGTCGCGNGPPCGTGLKCSAGACVCDPSTCAGCCSASGQCVGGTMKQACGVGGAACAACAGSSQCVNGACT
jgi:hypothetical protein